MAHTFTFTSQECELLWNVAWAMKKGFIDNKTIFDADDEFYECDFKSLAVKLNDLYWALQMDDNANIQTKED